MQAVHFPFILFLASNDDYQSYYTPQYISSKSSNYLDHYNKDYFYHNLTGYPQLGQLANDVEYDYNYYDYNGYEPEPAQQPQQPPSNKKTGIVAPHPMVTALQNFVHGIQSRTFDLGGVFSGNTIVSTNS